MLVALFLTSQIASAADPKAGTVMIENALGVPARVDGDYYIDATGTRVPLSGYWMFGVGESARVQFNGKDIVARELLFRLTTADGQSRGWFVNNVNDKNELRGLLNAATLKTHGELVAADRKDGKADIGVIQVLVPEGGTVSIGEWKALVYKGATLITTPNPLKAGEAMRYTIKVSHTSGGKTLTEEGTFYLDPTVPQEWDCRDIVSPEKLARTARYVHVCRLMEAQLSRKLTDKSTLAERGQVYRMISERFDGLPVRGVDEDAVTHNLTIAESYTRLADQIKAGKATQADLDTLKSEMNLRGNRVRKTLEARYGDRYTDALTNGGKVAPITLALKPTTPSGSTGGPTYLPPPPAPMPMDRNKEQRVRLQADITSTNGTISFYERQQRDLTEKIFAARAAVVLAQAAYERANGIAEELLAGAALATAKTVLEDLLRDQQRCQNGLRDARDRLSRLQRDLDNLGR
jgi:hypothetical protein